MNVPACSLWWLLAAVLLGWLLCGWFARHYLPLVTGGSVEQDREIQRLRAELAALRAQAPAGRSFNAAASHGADTPVQAAARIAAAADPASPEIDVAAARAAGLNLDGPEDLRVIEGVGPKIAQIFNAAGIRTFAQVAAMTPPAYSRCSERPAPTFASPTRRPGPNRRRWRLPTAGPN